MKCEKCGFDGRPIQEWLMAEKSSFVKLPEKTIEQHEEFVDSKKDVSEPTKNLAKGLVRLLGESGLMPFHETKYVCPKCSR